jgi:hypothetical protein
LAKAIYAKFKQPVKWDLITVVWLLIAFLEFGYLSTFVDTDPVLALKAMIGAILLLGGVVFQWIFIGIDFDWMFSKEETYAWMVHLFIALVAVSFVHFATLSSLSSLPLPRALFLQSIGISEEFIFRGFLLNWIMVMTFSFIIADVVSAGIGATYHAAVYGLSDQLMWVVFGSFIALGFVYYNSGRRLSVVLTAHGLINLLAVLGGS